MSHEACVIGAGPNGLSAAIVMAQAGHHVDILEAQAVAEGNAVQGLASAHDVRLLLPIMLDSATPPSSRATSLTIAAGSLLRAPAAHASVSSTTRFAAAMTSGGKSR